MTTSSLRLEIVRLESIVQWTVSDPDERHRLLSELDDAWSWAWEEPDRSEASVGWVRDVLNGEGTDR